MGLAGLSESASGGKVKNDSIDLNVIQSVYLQSSSSSSFLLDVFQRSWDEADPRLQI